MSFDPVAFKRCFPLFNQPENTQLVYLDNAATTQKPQLVLDGMMQFYLSSNGNAQRSSHRLARAATQMVAETRQKAAGFIGAASADEVAFVSGATIALNIIAHGLRACLGASDEVLLSLAEHHANITPWQVLSETTGASLRFEGLDSLNESSVSPHTKVITVTMASNGLGQVLDMVPLRRIKQAYPAMIVIFDASQVMAHQVINVQQLPCDFLVCSAHKFYGPTGVGLLYGRGDILNTLSPLVVGGEMVLQVSCDGSTYAKGPQRLEAGTSPLAAIAGLNACLDFWAMQSREAMAVYEGQLLHYLHQRLTVIIDRSDGGTDEVKLCVALLTQPEGNVGIAALAMSSPYAASDAGVWLDQCDIAVRVGQHCAQPLWASLGVDSVLRISLAAYNTIGDIDALVSALDEYFTSVNACFYGHAPHNDEDFSDVDWRRLLKPMPWQKRYKMIVQWGKRLTPKPDVREEAYRIRGCESLVWMRCYQREERYYFDVDSESALIKGLVVILLCRVQGQTAAAIRAVDIESYFQSLALDRYLSDSRLNGVRALFNAMLQGVRD